MIYRFTNRTTFNKWNNSSIKFFADDRDEAISFMKVRGIPNPWFVHPIKNGKVDKTKILTPKQLNRALKKFFGK
jgi:hypothetical protein